MLQFRKKTDGAGVALKKPLKARLAGKGKVVAGICLAVVLAVFFLSPKDARAGSAVLDLSGTTVLQYMDMEDSISATGTVESAESMMVYSTMAYTVQEVLVEVGDYVEEGQLLARLDGQNILDSIESQEASLSASSGTSAASIAAAKDNYEQFKATLEDGLNSSMRRAPSPTPTTAIPPQSIHTSGIRRGWTRGRTPLCSTRRRPCAAPGPPWRAPRRPIPTPRRTSTTRKTISEMPGTAWRMRRTSWQTWRTI